MEEFKKMVEEEAKAIVESEKKDLVIKEEKSVDFEKLQAEYLQKQVKEGKSITEITDDFVKAGVTSEIVKDEDGKYDKFHQELAQERKETIKESFRQDRIKKQAETLTTKQQKAEAFYVSFRPILEFDFSPLIHKKEKEDKVEKTYKDRSYGIPLMVLMLALFVVPYCAFSIILALFNGINAIFEAIATFGKIAKVIALSIFVILIVCLATYFLMLGIDTIFGTSIVTRIGL